MMSFQERALRAQNPALKKLFLLAHEKQSNLVVSADVTSTHELVALIEQVGSEICMLKTHIDILDDFTPDFINTLNALKLKHHFLIFEDRKFADIGHTVAHQYGGGIYKIVQWADIINCHTVPGPGVIKGLRSVGLTQGAGLLLLAQMSSEGNLARGDYTFSTLAMAEEYPDFVIGFISQDRLIDDPCMIHLSPGVSFVAEGDALGQQYRTPQRAIAEGNDMIIVGRGILKAKDPRSEAKRYKEAGFSALFS